MLGELESEVAFHCQRVLNGLDVVGLRDVVAKENAGAGHVGTVLLVG